MGSEKYKRKSQDKNQEKSETSTFQKMETSSMKEWLAEAYKEAQIGLAEGGLPIGSVLVDATGNVVSRAHRSQPPSAERGPHSSRGGRGHQERGTSSRLGATHSCVDTLPVYHVHWGLSSL